ncbi:MAG: hypothetical protein KGQ46_12225 [Hyphomicrobiales bacterium]|nr:hypothetical protein [Hyphomicrobiales bacterium]MDE2115182.1 hypothetical protein [Hyphomicrobiales bacterium]
MSKTTEAILTVPVDAAADVTGLGHNAGQPSTQTLAQTILRQIEAEEIGTPTVPRKPERPRRPVDAHYWPIEQDLAL